MTSTQILKQLQIISKRHQVAQPRIAVDSFALVLNMKQMDLYPHLDTLEFEGYITRQGKTIEITEKGLAALA